MKVVEVIKEGVMQGGEVNKKGSPGRCGVYRKEEIVFRKGER